MRRVNVVVTEEQHGLLTQLGLLQKRSAASFLRELLDAATPSLRVILNVLSASRQVEDAQPVMLLHASKMVIAEAFGDDSQQMDLIQHIASVVASMAEREHDGGGADRSASEDRTDAVERSDPPSCNYGGQV